MKSPRPSSPINLIIYAVSIMALLLLVCVIVPYYRFQQDDFLYHKNGKKCGDEYSPNVYDFLVCSPNTFHVKGNTIHLGYDGRDGKPLYGEIVKREWGFIIKDSSVYIRFYPHKEIHRYCLK